jgi:thioredoxin reductase
MTTCHDVAIVGAGPYGLSLAAHLKASGRSFRIFGDPMETWRERMPDGMLLKSDGFASNLSDPAAAFTLKHFCETKGIPYDDTRIPVNLETFRAYGLAFQQRMVSDLEVKQVIGIENDAGVYRFYLNDGSSGAAQNVVLAVGISHFQHLPLTLGQLPAELASHSSAHRKLERFRGRDVTVIGGGASAIDLAVLLREGGAEVTLVARRSFLRFNDPPAATGDSFWQQVRRPRSPIGPGWKARFYTDVPWLFHRLPLAARMRAVHERGSAAGWPMRERFLGRVPGLLGYNLEGATVRHGRVRLVLAGPEGTKEHATDHVIAATGYQVDVNRLTFLSREILSKMRAVQNSPVLSAEFESSVPGLYFAGVASAMSFGPVMRFACGADWTARRISKRLARVWSRKSASSLAVEMAGRAS